MQHTTLLALLPVTSHSQVTLLRSTYSEMRVILPLLVWVVVALLRLVVVIIVLAAVAVDVVVVWVVVVVVIAVVVGVVEGVVVGVVVVVVVGVVVVGTVVGVAGMVVVIVVGCRNFSIALSGNRLILSCCPIYTDDPVIVKQNSFPILHELISPLS